MKEWQKPMLNIILIKAEDVVSTSIGGNAAADDLEWKSFNEEGIYD